DAFDLVLQLHAERPVVPARSGSAVDLAGLEDESAPLAEGDERLHRDHGRQDSTATGMPRLATGPVTPVTPCCYNKRSGTSSTRPCRAASAGLGSRPPPPSRWSRTRTSRLNLINGAGHHGLLCSGCRTRR